MISRQGVALISSLIALVVIMALGVGAIFLTQVNLNISSNTNLQTQVKFQTESAVDATLIALDTFVEENQELPTDAADFALPTLSVKGQQIALNASAPTVLGNSNSSEAAFRLSTQGPRNAAHETSVLVEIQTGNAATDGPPPERRLEIHNGIASEGTFTINGSSKFINTGLHGNRGYTMNGVNNHEYAVCVERRSNGKCRVEAPLHEDEEPVCTERRRNGTCRTYLASNSAENLPVYAAAGEPRWTCNPSNKQTHCEGGRPVNLRPGITVEVDYEGLYARALADADVGEGNGVWSPTHEIYCDVVINGWPPINSVNDLYTQNILVREGSPGAGEERTVCLQNGINFPAETNLNNVRLLAGNDVNFNGNNALIENSTIMSKRGSVNPRSTTIKDSGVYSRNGINLNGSSVIEGKTTLASAGSVTLNGRTEVARTADGDLAVGLVVVSKQNISVNGSSDLVGYLVAEGSVHFNGRANLSGGVASKRDVTINGGIEIDSGLPLINTVLEEEDNDDGNAVRAERARVLSRR